MIEVVTVVALTLSIYCAIGYEIYWVLLAPDADQRQARVVAAVKQANESWKAGLLLLIPLFYRTIRKFLERVEKFAGMTAPREPQAPPSVIPTPPEQEDS